MVAHACNPSRLCYIRLSQKSKKEKSQAEEITSLIPQLLWTKNPAEAPTRLQPRVTQAIVTIFYNLISKVAYVPFV